MISFCLIVLINIKIKAIINYEWMTYAVLNPTSTDLFRSVICDTLLMASSIRTTLVQGRKEMFYLTTHSTHFISWLYGV